MEESSFTAKWKMLTPKSFIAEKEGYMMTVKMGGWYPYWAIIKNGIVVDESFYHTPAKCELSARVQAERFLNKLLNQIQNHPH